MKNSEQTKDLLKEAVVTAVNRKEKYLPYLMWVSIFFISIVQ